MFLLKQISYFICKPTPSIQEQSMSNFGFTQGGIRTFQPNIEIKTENSVDNELYEATQENDHITFKINFKNMS